MELEWRKINLHAGELILLDVLPTGQAFRWHKTKEKPEEWTGVIGHRLFTLQQGIDKVLFYVHNVKPSEEDVKILHDYFQLDISCVDLISQWSKKDRVLAEAAACCTGVRILNQDPIETLFAFICSSNNNIPRISLMMNRLCIQYGTPLGSYCGKEYYSFPSLEALNQARVESRLRDLGFGYRAKYVTGAAKYILTNYSKLWLESLRDVDYSDAWSLLQEIPGVGPKVADCVCLMALGKAEAVPIDTHMWQLAVKQYGLKVNGNSLSMKNYRQIGDMFRSRFGEYAGWAQAVLFRKELLRTKK